MWTLGWSVCSVPAAKDSPALMRIPIIGPNLHTWPQAPPLYIANERVEQKKRADLTEDAPHSGLYEKILSLSYQILRNDWE